MWKDFCRTVIFFFFLRITGFHSCANSNQVSWSVCECERVSEFLRVAVCPLLVCLNHLHSLQSTRSVFTFGRSPVPSSFGGGAYNTLKNSFSIKAHVHICCLFLLFFFFFLISFGTKNSCSEEQNSVHHHHARTSEKTKKLQKSLVKCGRSVTSWTRQHVLH